MIVVFVDAANGALSKNKMSLRITLTEYGGFSKTTNQCKNDTLTADLIFKRDDFFILFDQ